MPADTDESAAGGSAPRERYGVIGDPIAHSLSPAMHNAAFAHLGLSARYESMEIRSQELRSRMTELRGDPQLRGLNVTVPHKETIARLLANSESSSIAPSAEAIGAVNTVVIRNGHWHGHNTDAGGLVRSLITSGVELRGKRVAVLGAGGAARAAVVGLIEAGVSSLTVAARRGSQARELLDSLRSQAQDPNLASDLKGRTKASTIRQLADPVDVLIQATSATLETKGPSVAKSFAESIPWERLFRNGNSSTPGVVLDMVYRPRTTSVLRRAKELGLTTVDGLGMLLYQGCLAFELWTQTDAPEAVMRAALESALDD